MNVENFIVFAIFFLQAMVGSIKADEAISDVTAREIIQEIINSENRIHDVEVKMRCEYLESNYSLPFKINYEYDWGYEQGKEYCRGIRNALTASDQKQIKQEVEIAFDGDKRYIFRHTIGDPWVGGAVRSMGSSSFKGFLTPNILLGFGAQEHGRQTLGEALLLASESRIAAKEEIDGHLCYLIEAINIRSPISEDSHNVRVWVDPERDFRPLRFERYRNYSKSDPWKALARVVEGIKLAEVNGIWFPVEGVRSTYRVTEILPPDGMEESKFNKLTPSEYKEVGKCVLKKSKPVRKLFVDKNSIRINQGIPIEKFRVQFPQGCRVWDEFLQMGYTVGGPSKTSDRMLEQLNENENFVVKKEKQQTAVVPSEIANTLNADRQVVSDDHENNDVLENNVPLGNEPEKRSLFVPILCCVGFILAVSVIFMKIKGGRHYEEQ